MNGFHEAVRGHPQTNETFWLAPKRAVKKQCMMQQAAFELATGGEKIFTPTYVMVGGLPVVASGQ